MHELLRRNGIASPVVLVGASFGGLNARVYSSLYPDEVAGLVLVDAASEEEPRLAPKFFLAPSPPRYFWYPLHLLFQTGARIGLVRLTRPSGAPAKNREEMIRALRRQPKSVVSDALTGIVMAESYEQARSVGALGDLPLVVLTAGKPMVFGDPKLDRQTAAYHAIWVHQIQARMARLSAQGRQVIVENSDHAITEHAPEAVLTAVQEVLARSPRYNSKVKTSKR